jgi:hypothetical protein
MQLPGIMLSLYSLGVTVTEAYICIHKIHFDINV